MVSYSGKPVSGLTANIRHHQIWLNWFETLEIGLKPQGEETNEMS